ncbi:hypothetical protein [Nocardia transvalensis]|uniref:hypothetical protein n=1 Tax=Nocardia transvalensis TaxID=37333 RepID=UPI0018939393|nr:hypothetical protein [Nocardia transvalensis]MBF6329784.1 hypothetical protein [Nocardia transvalensis]
MNSDDEINTKTSLDWDNALRDLLSACGIDPDTAQRPNPRTIFRRRLKAARAGMAATGIAAPAVVVTAVSGAPPTAVVPVCVWGVGWIGYGIWVSVGAPHPLTVITHGWRLIRRGAVLGWRWLNHRAYQLRDASRLPAPADPATEAPPF